VKLIRRNMATQSVAQPQPQTQSAASIYLFYEKASGTAHFHVEAGPSGELPIDHAAGLLAMHCMVRGQSPSDYLIMVPTATENLGEVTEKAQRLLDAGQSVKTSVKLTRREKEVLDGVLRSLANKEIASELNLSERTVKFHVSSLLSKFKVHSRMELMREASQRAMKPSNTALGSPVPAQATIRPFARSTEMPGQVVNSSKILPLARPRLMA
jgi:DNA-binding NarL/FixJ family response regulator